MIVIVYCSLMALLIIPTVAYFASLKFLPDNLPSLQKDHASGSASNGISAVIACHNEEENIRKKIFDIAEQFHYANFSINEIIVVSDGSNDESNNILETLAADGVIRLIKEPIRQGKANALNKGINAANYPILLLCDVRQALSQGAIKALVSNLSDPHVGAVTSQLELTGNESPTRKWMNELKIKEARKGSTTGVIGALYVVRKALLEELPVDTILDDFLVALFVMSKGKRIDLNPNAIIYDLEFDLFYAEKRQGRITAGLIQILTKHHKYILQIGTVQQLFLYGQKYLKYTAPMLFITSSIVALFNSKIAIWHYSISLSISFIISLTHPLFVRQFIRLTTHYMAQLFTLEKHTAEKWKR